MKKYFLLLILSIPFTTIGATVADTEIPETFQLQSHNLQLNGAGVRVKWFVKVYAAGLYLESVETDPEKIISADRPMAIQLRFLRSVGFDKIKEAQEDGFKRGAGDKFIELKPKIDQFNSYFTKDTEDGSIYDFTYTPGIGTVLIVNGKKMPAIQGLAFKQALFNIWLGKEPSDEDLRLALLNPTPKS